MVCHCGGGTNWPQNYISEVTSDRRMMQSYGCEIDDRRNELGSPICVAIASGTSLVADWGAVDSALTERGADVDVPDSVMVANSSSSFSSNRHRDHGAGRVMVFDSELRLTRTFPVIAEECAPSRGADVLSVTRSMAPRPTRLCYVPQKNVLLIGTECGRVVVRRYPDDS